MLASGDFLTPHLNGSRYFEKPPLLYWAVAGPLAILGENPFAARLPPRLATLGTTALLALGAAGSLVPGSPASAGPGAGAWSALVYLSSALSFALGRINILDGLLAFTLTLSLFPSGISCAGERGANVRRVASSCLVFRWASRCWPRASSES